jgi:hypothetical protein
MRTEDRGSHQKVCDFGASGFQGRRTGAEIIRSLYSSCPLGFKICTKRRHSLFGAFVRGREQGDIPASSLQGRLPGMSDEQDSKTEIAHKEEKKDREGEKEREERIERVRETHSDLTVVARASRRSCSNLSCAIARALSS